MQNLHKFIKVICLKTSTWTITSTSPPEAPTMSTRPLLLLLFMAFYSSRAVKQLVTMVIADNITMKGTNVSKVL